MLAAALAAPELLPHGVCYAWEPGLLWLNVISDAGIAIAYFSIPVSLGYLLRKRSDGPFNWVVSLFAVFIICCGTTHVFEIIGVWSPIFWISGIAKAITAFTSILTAVLLVPFLPRALRLPNPIADPLTSLPNRGLFNDRLQRALERLRRHPERALAVFFLDLDDFKSINDRFGHAAGDEVLCGVARRLIRCVRPNDTVARRAGDEFTVLLEDVPTPDVAVATARRLLSALSEPFMVGNTPIVLGASIGIAHVAEPGEAEQVVAIADEAMYRAKARGRGEYELAGERPTLATVS